MQQYLPFTVLKRLTRDEITEEGLEIVATVLTVYGIETFLALTIILVSPQVATVLTVYGIET